MLAAGGAGDVMLVDEGLHLGMGVCINGLVQLIAGFCAPVLNDLVGAEALIALTAVHQRIGEALEMAGGDPGLGIHQDGGVKTHVVAVFLNELLPPCALYVVLQLNAEGAVVPGVGEAAVDLGAGEDVAAVFAQGDDFVHGFFGVFHFSSFPAAGCRRDKFLCITQIIILAERAKYSKCKGNLIPRGGVFAGLCVSIILSL